MTVIAARAVKRLRNTVARLVGLRSNAGLTRKQRRDHSSKINTIAGPITLADAEALALWRERRL